jgi:hypothetical protein
MRKWIGAVTVAACVVAGAGAHVDAAGAETFVGRVQDSNAYIAVSKDGRKIGGYVCDDGSGSRWIEYAWLKNGVAPLRAGTTRERLGSVRVAGTTATGTVSVRGVKHSFSAKRVSKGDAGLHFAVGKQSGRLLVAGWILLPDGTQRGAISQVNSQTLRSIPATKAPTLNPKVETIKIAGDPQLPPVVTEPQPLVVINIIAILIALLIPAVQK